MQHTCSYWKKRGREKSAGFLAPLKIRLLIDNSASSKTRSLVGIVTVVGVCATFPYSNSQSFLMVWVKVVCPAREHLMCGSVQYVLAKCCLLSEWRTL